MKKRHCTSCGSEDYEERRIEYLYSHDGKYLLVPNTPVEVCLACGTVYYDVAVLKGIEQQFFAIQRNEQTPDRYVQMSEVAYA